MYSASARALNSIIQAGRFTVNEMADVAGCSDKHLYNVRNGEAELRQSQIERLSRWLCRHGETRIARQFVCAEYAVVRRAAGTADGSVKSEIVRLVHAAADIDDAHGERNAEALDASICMLRAVLADLEAERSALKL